MSIRNRSTPLSATSSFARPFTTVDVVIFTVLEGSLQVLLVKRPEVSDAPDQTNEPFPGQRALPGGYLDLAQDATLLDCALRKLRDKTGLQESPYLEQLGSWGSAHRDPRGWSATHVYFALVVSEGVQLDLGAAWFPVALALKRDKLAFDHTDILQAAVERLRSKVEYTSLPAFLLPEPFTLPQLQRMYEIVLDRPLDKSGFRTRMLAADFLEAVGLVESDSKRPPQGYRLKEHSQAVVFPRTFNPKVG